MLGWYWKVRIHDSNGGYWLAEVWTGRSLDEIDSFKDAYEMLTGCKMLLEGMSEQPFEGLSSIQDAFNGLWVVKNKPPV